MVWLVKLFLTVLLLHEKLEESAAQDDENPVVTIENGPVKGQKNYTVGGNNTYYSFRGIPYAEPPLDDLRFAAPVKVSNWTDTLDATADKSQCVQDSDPVTGSEDCLYINVYTPSLTETNLTVMVYIHGGAFVGGNSSYASLGPDYLLDEGVIYVALNYRLGIFGFISTADEVCPGNWGLKDQVLALQWVQSNIAYFGGDPSNVTIFGESAGAACVSYLLQTNETLGLFSAAIMQSGTSLNLWALNRRASRTAFKVGATLGIITTNSSVLIEGLREVNYTELQTASVTVSTLITLENALEGIYYGPVIEPDVDGALFVSDSHELLSEGGFHQIPTIIGGTSNEASAIETVPAVLRLYVASYNLHIQDYAPFDLTDSSTDTDRLAAGLEIRNRYFGLLGLDLSSETIVQFISDDQFNRPSREAALQQAKYTPVYYYVFSYQGELGGVENRTLTGVGHAEDLGYIFRTNYTNVSDTDALVRSRLVRLWTNFAKYSDPTPTDDDDSVLGDFDWETIGTDSSAVNFLNITEDLEMEQNPFNESMIFYEGIYSDYGQPPYDTY